MRLLTVFVFFVFCVQLNAQVNFPDHFDTLNPYGKQLIVNGQFDFQSTAIRNEMVNKFIFGGFIDEGMKNRSFNKHGRINFAGMTSNNDITYFHGSDSLFGNSKYDWGIKAGYYALGSAKYTTDAFGLVFYGNESYLGDTATFSNSQVSFALYQKLGFGLRNKATGSYFFLNLINVQDYFVGTIRHGDLYQTSDASQIEMKLLGDMAYTNGSQFSKGLGASIDFSYKMNVPWVKGASTVMELKVENIGFATINTPMQYYRVDSTYSFSGFRMNQLFGDNSVFNRDDYSVLDSLGVERDSTYKKTVFLPGYIQAGKLIDYNSAKKMQSYFGIRLYPSLKSNPIIYGGAAYKPGKNIMLVGNLAYGGFTTVRGGLSATYLSNKLNVSIGTDDIFGLISSKGFGKSLFLRSVWNLD